MANKFMECALELAHKAADMGEVPVGAVIVRGNQVVAVGCNQRETMRQPYAHAEFLAVQHAAAIRKDWRLADCDMYVTLEPCPMCASLIIDARLRRLYFGAWSSGDGCCGSLLDLFALRGSKCEIYGGIMERECSEVLTKFFNARRQQV